MADVGLPDLRPSAVLRRDLFSPTRHDDIPGFKDLILALAEAWKNKRAEIDRTGAEITSHLKSLNDSNQSEERFGTEHLDIASRELVKSYDWDHEGWGAAPKFLQPMALEFLIRRTEYRKLATRNAEFVLTTMYHDHRLHHAWRQGKLGDEVFLDDYGSLILGLIELYQTDFNLHWFKTACQLAEEMIDIFTDPFGGFYDTEAGADRLLIRPKDLQDNASSSGNALAAAALLKLST